MLEVLNVMVEQGFAGSTTEPGFEDPDVNPGLPGNTGGV